VVSYALTIQLPSCHQVPYFLTCIICSCIPYVLAKVLARFIGNYLGGERGRKWIYGIGYQVGTMVTQLWSIHNGVIGIVGFSKSIDSMTKNKSLLRSGQSGLGDKENKKG